MAVAVLIKRLDFDCRCLVKKLISAGMIGFAVVCFSIFELMTTPLIQVNDREIPRLTCTNDRPVQQRY